MSFGVGCRCGSDPALLWLWRRLAATAPIGPLTWEPPYAAGAAQEMAKGTKKKKKLSTFSKQYLVNICGFILVEVGELDFLLMELYTPHTYIFMLKNRMNPLH